MRDWRRNVLVACVAGALLLGCDRQSNTKNPPVVKTTVRDEGEPEAPPDQATSRPSTSVLMIGGEEVKFPAARLVTQQDEPMVEVLLFSDDPPAALKPNYSGSRYYFTLKLQIDELGKLTATDYSYRATSSERQDTPDGIFVDGDKRVLQPFDWHVAFSQQGNLVAVSVDGIFSEYRGRDDAPLPMKVPVRGVLMVQIEDPGKTKK